MTSDSDPELLQCYLAGGPRAQAAFAALVTRHVDLVYSAALRTVRSPQLAEDVAQAVFVELARRARSLTSATPLVAWLHVVTRRKAIDVVRHESRRRSREAAMALLQDAPAMPAPPDWPAIEPLLDEAVESLPPADRAAILLRFFENKSLREIGAALGATEDAAQKRVTRALDRLRIFFLKRGLALSTGSLATTLSAHGMVPAPGTLGPAIAAATTGLVPAAAVSGSTILAMTTLQKIGTTVALAAAAVTAYEAIVLLRQQEDLTNARSEVLALATQVRELSSAQKAAADSLHRSRLRLTEVSVPLPGDAALEAQMQVWLAQLGRLKQFLRDQPRLAGPELALITEHDWFTEAAVGKLSSDEDFRRAAGQLRRRATDVIHPQLHRALAAYVRAHDDQLPVSPRELAPYFEEPFDLAVLDRYQMLRQGKVSDVPQRERSQLIGRMPVDIEYDDYSYVGVSGYGNQGNMMSHNYYTAQREFRKANPGETTNDAARLHPYLKWPVDVTVLQNFIDKRSP